MSIIQEIECYQQDYLPVLLEIKQFYKSLKDVPEVIDSASKGQIPSGRMDRHQWRVGYEKGTVGSRELLLKLNRIEEANSFEEIFEITEEVKKTVYGLGELWSYDTALRIGFKKGFYPENVYVQAGVKDGVKKALGITKVKERSLPVTRFPESFRKLRPYQLENFLCIWGKKKTICKTVSL